MRNAKLLLLTAILAAPGLAQMDPSGEWAPQFDEDFLERIPGPDIGDYLGLPINDAARLRGDSWDASLLTLPENQCRPHPSDYAWRGPANLRIWKEVDRETQKLIAYHTHISWQAPERTIWMDGRPHPPADAAHTWQGFSTGKWDGDVLTITTTHLKEGWIRRNGIPRSENATITEHLFRHDDHLTVMVIIDDPDYLDRAVRANHRFCLRLAPADRSVSLRIRSGGAASQGNGAESFAGRQQVSGGVCESLSCAIRGHAGRRRNHVSGVRENAEGRVRHAGRRQNRGRDRCASRD